MNQLRIKAPLSTTYHQGRRGISRTPSTRTLTLLSILVCLLLASSSPVMVQQEGILYSNSSSNSTSRPMNNYGDNFFFSFRFVTFAEAWQITRVRQWKCTSNCTNSYSPTRYCQCTSPAALMSGVTYRPTFNFVTLHYKNKDGSQISYTNTANFWRDDVRNTGSMQFLAPTGTAGNGAWLETYITNGAGVTMERVFDFTFNIDALGGQAGSGPMTATLFLSGGTGYTWGRDWRATLDFYTTSTSVWDHFESTFDSGTTNETKTNSAGSLTIDQMVTGRVRVTSVNGPAYDDGIRFIPAFSIISDPMVTIAPSMNTIQQYRRGRMSVTVTLTADAIDGGFVFTQSPVGFVPPFLFQFEKRGYVVPTCRYVSASVTVCSFARDNAWIKRYQETVTAYFPDVSVHNTRYVWNGMSEPVNVGTFPVTHLPSKTKTMTVSQSVTTTLSVTISKSHPLTTSLSLSQTVSLSSTVTLSATVSQSVSATASPSISATRELRVRGTATTTATPTSTLLIPTASVSHTLSLDTSLTRSIDETVTLSVSKSGSGNTVSLSKTLPFTPTRTRKPTQSRSITRTIVETSSRSLKITSSKSQSLSLTLNRSNTVTIHPSVTLSRSVSVSDSGNGKTQSRTLRISPTRSAIISMTASLEVPKTLSLPKTISHSVVPTASRTVKASRTNTVTRTLRLEQTQTAFVAATFSRDFTRTRTPMKTPTAVPTLTSDVTVTETHALTTTRTVDATASNSLSMSGTQSVSSSHLGNSPTATITVTASSPATPTSELPQTETLIVAGTASHAITKTKTLAQTQTVIFRESRTSSKTYGLTPSRSVDATNSAEITNTIPPPRTDTRTVTLSQSVSGTVSPLMAPLLITITPIDNYESYFVYYSTGVLLTIRHESLDAYRWRPVDEEEAAKESLKVSGRRESVMGSTNNKTLVISPTFVHPALTGNPLFKSVCNIISVDTLECMIGHSGYDADADAIVGVRLSADQIISPRHWEGRNGSVHIGTFPILNEDPPKSPSFFTVINVLSAVTVLVTMVVGGPWIEFQCLMLMLRSSCSSWYDQQAAKVAMYLVAPLSQVMESAEWGVVGNIIIVGIVALIQFIINVILWKYWKKDYEVSRQFRSLWFNIFPSALFSVGTLLYPGVCYWTFCLMLTGSDSLSAEANFADEIQFGSKGVAIAVGFIWIIGIPVALVLASVKLLPSRLVWTRYVTVYWKDDAGAAVKRMVTYQGHSMEMLKASMKPVTKSGSRRRQAAKTMRGGSNGGGRRRGRHAGRKFDGSDDDEGNYSDASLSYSSSSSDDNHRRAEEKMRNAAALAAECEEMEAEAAQRGFMGTLFGGTAVGGLLGLGDGSNKKKKNNNNNNSALTSIGDGGLMMGEEGALGEDLCITNKNNNNPQQSAAMMRRRSSARRLSYHGSQLNGRQRDNDESDGMRVGGRAQQQEEKVGTAEEDDDNGNSTRSAGLLPPRRRLNSSFRAFGEGSFNNNTNQNNNNSNSDSAGLGAPRKNLLTAAARRRSSIMMAPAAAAVEETVGGGVVVAGGNDDDDDDAQYSPREDGPAAAPVMMMGAAADAPVRKSISSQRRTSRFAQPNHMPMAEEEVDEDFEQIHEDTSAAHAMPMAGVGGGANPNNTNQNDRQQSRRGGKRPPVINTQHKTMLAAPVFVVDNAAASHNGHHAGPLVAAQRDLEILQYNDTIVKKVSYETTAVCRESVRVDGSWHRFFIPQGFYAPRARNTFAQANLYPHRKYFVVLPHIFVIIVTLLLAIQCTMDAKPDDYTSGKFFSDQIDAPSGLCLVSFIGVMVVYLLVAIIIGVFRPYRTRFTIAASLGVYGAGAIVALLAALGTDFNLRLVFLIITFLFLLARSIHFVVLKVWERMEPLLIDVEDRRGVGAGDDLSTLRRHEKIVLAEGALESSTDSDAAAADAKRIVRAEEKLGDSDEDDDLLLCNGKTHQFPEGGPTANRLVRRSSAGMVLDDDDEGLDEETIRQRKEKADRDALAEAERLRRLEAIAKVRHEKNDLNQRLKEWKAAYQHIHGCKPKMVEIRRDPTINAVFERYQVVKAELDAMTGGEEGADGDDEDGNKTKKHTHNYTGGDINDLWLNVQKAAIKNNVDNDEHIVADEGAHGAPQHTIVEFTGDDHNARTAAGGHGGGGGVSDDEGGYHFPTPPSTQGLATSGMGSGVNFILSPSSSATAVAIASDLPGAAAATLFSRILSANASANNKDDAHQQPPLPLASSSSPVTIPDDITLEEIALQKAAINHELKAWKERYVQAHDGKKPKESDIKKDPTMGPRYELYGLLKEREKDLQEASAAAAAAIAANTDNSNTMNGGDATAVLQPDGTVANLMMSGNGIAAQTLSNVQILNLNSGTMVAPEQEQETGGGLSSPTTATAAGSGLPIAPSSTADAPVPPPAAPTVSLPPGMTLEAMIEEKAAINHELKAWKERYVQAHDGKKPKESDIRKDPTMGPRYELYGLLKEAVEKKEKEQQRLAEVQPTAGTEEVGSPLSSPPPAVTIQPEALSPASPAASSSRPTLTIPDNLTFAEVVAEKAAINHELKAWKERYVQAHDGKKPKESDIRKDPTMGPRYELYGLLKERETALASAPAVDNAAAAMNEEVAAPPPPAAPPITPIASPHSAADNKYNAGPPISTSPAARKKDLTKILKDWKQSFADAHNGKNPSQRDVDALPEIAALFAELKRLKTAGTEEDGGTTTDIVAASPPPHAHRPHDDANTTTTTVTTTTTTTITISPSSPLVGQPMAPSAPAAALTAPPPSIVQPPSVYDAMSKKDQKHYMKTIVDAVKTFKSNFMASHDGKKKPKESDLMNDATIGPVFVEYKRLKALEEAREREELEEKAREHEAAVLAANEWSTPSAMNRQQQQHQQGSINNDPTTTNSVSPFTAASKNINGQPQQQPPPAEDEDMF